MRANVMCSRFDTFQNYEKFNVGCTMKGKGIFLLRWSGEWGCSKQLWFQNCVTCHKRTCMWFFGGPVSRRRGKNNISLRLLTISNLVKFCLLFTVSHHNTWIRIAPSNRREIISVINTRVSAQLLLLLLIRKYRKSKFLTKNGREELSKERHQSWVWQLGEYLRAPYIRKNNSSNNPGMHHGTSRRFDRQRTSSESSSIDYINTLTAPNVLYRFREGCQLREWSMYLPCYT